MGPERSRAPARPGQAANGTPPRSPAGPPPADRGPADQYRRFAVIVVGLVALDQLNRVRRGVLLVDPLWISGVALYVVVLPYLGQLPARVNEAVRRLRASGLLAASGESDAVLARLHGLARRWGDLAQVFPAGLIMIA
jgi:hypothetical protein